MKSLLTYTQAAEVLNTTYVYIKNKAVPAKIYPVVEVSGKVYIAWDALSERVKARADMELAARYMAENARELARKAREQADISRLTDLAADALTNLEAEAMRRYRKLEVHAYYTGVAKVKPSIADDCQKVAAWMLVLANDVRNDKLARERGFIDLADCYEQVANKLRTEGYHNITFTGDGRRFRDKVAAFRLPAVLEDRNGEALVVALGETRLRSLLSGKLGNQSAAKADLHRNLVHRIYIGATESEGARLDAVEVQARYAMVLADMLQDALEEHGDAVRQADYEPADVRTIRNWITELQVLGASDVHGKARATSMYKPHHHRAKPKVNVLWSGDGWAAPTTGSTQRKTWIWYDSATGCAVGWCNSMDGEGESTRVILTALRHAFEQTGTLPAKIQMDYSMMSRAELREAIERMGIQVVAKEAGKPNSSYAERNNLELGKVWKRVDANWISTSAASANTRRRREDIGHSIPKMTNSDWSAMVDEVLAVYNGTPRPMLGLHPDRKHTKVVAERYYCPREAWVRQMATASTASTGSATEMDAPTAAGVNAGKQAWIAYYMGNRTKATINRGDIVLVIDGVRTTFRLPNYWEHLPPRTDTLVVEAARFDRLSDQQDIVHLFYASGGAYIGIASRIEGWEEGDRDSIATQSAEVARYERAAKKLRESARIESDAATPIQQLRQERAGRGAFVPALPTPNSSPDIHRDFQQEVNTKYDLFAKQRQRVQNHTPQPQQLNHQPKDEYEDEDYL